MNRKLVEQLEQALPSGLSGVIFDCDGVLLNSRDSNIRYYNLAREYFGLPPMNEADEHYVHMHTGMQSLTRVLPAHCLERLGEAMQGIDYMRDLVPYISPEEGIFELLQGLKEKGQKLAVHTNRTTLASEVLICFHLKDYFDPVITAGTHQPKPNPEGIFAILDHWQVDADKVLFVGDSQLDAKAAHAAKIKLVAYKNPELPASVYVEDFKEFSKALNEFLK